MIPTKRGPTIVVVGVVLYGLAWLTSIGWFYVADSMVWAVLAVNMPLPWLNVRGLVAQRGVGASAAGDVFEDDTVKVTISLQNRSLLPKSLIGIQERCPLAAPDEMDKGFYVGTIVPFGSEEATYEARCYRRGVYTFGPLKLETSAPFGLFRARRSVEAPLAVTVYPQVVPIDSFVNQGALQGNSPVLSLPGPSGEFRGAREYRPTDRRRDIHWRGSARRGQLMVREFDRIPQGEVRVAFNPEFDLGVGRDTTLEYAIKIAASLALRCFQDGRPFRMWPSPDEGAAGSWHRVLEFLARLQPGRTGSIGELLGQSNRLGVSIAVVSAADPDSLSAIERSGHSSRLTVVVLEGFDDEEDARPTSVLAGSGTDVVSCTPGHLPETVRALGRVISVPESRSRATKEAVRTR